MAEREHTQMERELIAALERAEMVLADRVSNDLTGRPHSDHCALCPAVLEEIRTALFKALGPRAPAQSVVQSAAQGVGDD